MYVLPDANASLPPYTEIGAGTLACKVNGNSWWPVGRTKKPWDHWYQNPSVSLKPVLNYYSFSIQAAQYYRIRNKSIALNQFELRIDSFYGIGIYPLSYRPTQSIIPRNKIFFSYQKDTASCGAIQSFTPISGAIEIKKFDNTNKTISGTFKANIRHENQNCGDSIRISDGRFDLKFD